MLPPPPHMDELADCEENDLLHHHIVDGKLRPPAWGVVYTSRQEAEAHVQVWGGRTGTSNRSVMPRERGAVAPPRLHRDSCHPSTPQSPDPTSL